MSDESQPYQYVAPTVTELEAQLKTAGQRHISEIWEYTQAFVAIAVTLATLGVSACLALRDEKQVAAFMLLSSAFFLVVGFYFGRTNHTRVGGIGVVEGQTR